MKPELYQLTDNRKKFKGAHLIDFNDKSLMIPTNPIKECYKMSYNHLKDRNTHTNKQLKIVHHNDEYYNQSIIRGRHFLDTNELLSQGDITIAKCTQVNSIHSQNHSQTQSQFINNVDSSNISLYKPKRIKIITVRPSEDALTKDNIAYICTQKTELLFHNIKCIESLSVLYDEIKVLDEIIELSLLKGNEVDDFEVKRLQCQLKINIIELSILNGTMNLNAYDLQVKRTLVKQNEILRHVNLNSGYPYKKYLQNRIGKRIEIILQERIEIEEMLLEQRAIENELKYADHCNDNDDCAEKKDIQVNDESMISFQGKEEECINEEDKIKNDIESLIQDYEKAYVYLQNNNFEHKAKAQEIIRQLNNLHSLINKKEQVDASNLPPVITPEFIYGDSKDNRNCIFTDILNDIKRSYDETHGLYKTTKQYYQSLSKYLIDKYREKIKTRLSYLQKKNNINKQIYMKYSKAYLNEWCPAPIYQLAEHEENIEVINKSIEENMLEISIDQIVNPRKLAMRLIYSVDIVNDEPIKKVIQSNAKKVLTDKTAYVIEKASYEELYKHKVILNLYESSGFLFCKKEWLSGELTLKLEELKNHASIIKRLSFYKPTLIDLYDDGKQLKGDETIRSKIREKHDIKISIAIRIRKALINQEEERIKVLSKTVTKVYQPFKGENIDGYDIPFNIELAFDNDKFQEEQRQEIKDSVVLNLNTPKINKDYNHIRPPKIPQEQPKKQQWTSIQSIISPIDNNVQYDMNDFSPEELDDPQVEANLITCKVLDNAIMLLEQKMKKNDGKTPKPFRMKCSLLRAKKTKLEEMIASGELSIGGYVTIIRTAINHDKKLQKYFQENLLTQFEQIVTNRLKILMNEMGDMLRVAKNACK